MGIWIDEAVYNAIIAAGGEDGVDVEFDGTDYWFLNGDWSAFGLTGGDGCIYTISLTVSQEGVFVGNYEG